MHMHRKGWTVNKFNSEAAENANKQVGAYTLQQIRILIGVPNLQPAPEVISGSANLLSHTYTNTKPPNHVDNCQD